MKKILAVLLAGSCVAAFADDNGLYLGTGAGAAWNNVNNPAFSGRVDLGYNFNKWFAVELGTTGTAQSGSGQLNQTMQFYDLSVKGTWELSDAFALTGQFGGALASPGIMAAPSFTSGNPSQQNVDLALNPTIGQQGWDFLTAVGAQYNLTKQVSVNLTDYYYYGSTNFQGNTNVLLAGIKYNF